MNLKVMTYNIAGGRDHTNLPNVPKAVYNINACIDVIKNYSPDIVGLNEVDLELPRSNNDKMAEVIGNALGYNYYFAPALAEWSPRHYGNALVTKFPIVSAETIDIPEPEVKDEDTFYETRCVLHAVLDIEGKNVDVIVTHFGLAYKEREFAIETILNLVSTIKNPIIFMGDLNQDYGNEQLKPLTEVLFNTDDLLPEGTYSFPSHDGVKQKLKDGTYVPYRKCLIDYMMVSKEFKTTTAAVVEGKASDHSPYLCEFTF